jgi:hypothetical protein
MHFLNPTFAIRKDKIRVSVGEPELAQHQQRFVWERDESIFIAFGITDMYPHVQTIDIASFEMYPFSKAKAHTVKGKEEDSID